jgi:sulfate transport system ATP-binding protein
MFALVGASGCGKTTLLRMLAGFVEPSVGEIAIDGVRMNEVPPHERPVNMMFQSYALFPHMTVEKNIAFGLSVKPRRDRPNRKEVARRVRELLALVQLEGLGSRYPSQLSGGQRQRVALARALAIEPRMLLLDEPFGALDAKVRKELRAWLRQLHEMLGLTTIFVTHDQDEAFALADLVAVMNDGKIEQYGSPADVRQAPGTAFVREFIETRVH